MEIVLKSKQGYWRAPMVCLTFSSILCLWLVGPLCVIASMSLIFRGTYWQNSKFEGRGNLRTVYLFLPPKLGVLIPQINTEFSLIDLGLGTSWHCWNVPPTPRCAHICCLVSIRIWWASMSAFFPHLGIQFHTFAPYTLPRRMPLHQTAPLVPSVNHHHPPLTVWAKVIRWEALLLDRPS